MIRLLLVEDHKTVRQALREAAWRRRARCRSSPRLRPRARRLPLAEATGEIEVALMDVELRDPELGAEAASGVGAAVDDPARAATLPGRLLLHSGRRLLFPRVPRRRDSQPLRVRAQEQLSAARRCSRHCCKTPSPGAASSTQRSKIAWTRCAKDATSPRALLEPNELRVAELLAQGLTNEQIAVRLGLRDARAVSRTNGRIYDAWRLSESTTDEKVARARAALIYVYRSPDCLGRGWPRAGA